MFNLPKLPYSYNSLEPFIDAQTMEVHYTKHHQAYVDKLNSTLQNYPDLLKKNIQDLLQNLDKIPPGIRQGVINFGGGHLNHSFFWPLLKKNNGRYEGQVVKILIKKFGSFAAFKEVFSQRAVSLFGSGWVWLVVDNNNLEIIVTNNQDSPLSIGQKPILTLDVWEHAYYLKYQNRRIDYIKAFFEVINWKQVDKNFRAV